MEKLYGNLAEHGNGKHDGRPLKHCSRCRDNWRKFGKTWKEFRFFERYIGHIPNTTTFNPYIKGGPYFQEVEA